MLQNFVKIFVLATKKLRAFTTWVCRMCDDVIAADLVLGL